jgi:hypothetical protein
MTYSNASPLMVHGKNQQVLRWLRLRLSVVVVRAVAVLNEIAVTELLEEAAEVEELWLVAVTTPNLCQLHWL